MDDCEIGTDPVHQKLAKQPYYRNSKPKIIYGKLLFRYIGCDQNADQEAEQ